DRLIEESELRHRRCKGNNPFTRNEHFIANIAFLNKYPIDHCCFGKLAERCPRGNQKKRRWFSYRSSCSLQIRYRTSTLQPTEAREQESLSALSCFWPLCLTGILVIY